jgi:CENP-B N-terminal DNA-binding domain
MPLSVTPEIAQSVRKYQEQGFSQREIARRFNISLLTVHRILRGQWHPVDEREDPHWEEKLRAERCPGCGGLVYQWPCLACELQARKHCAPPEIQRAA